MIILRLIAWIFLLAAVAAWGAEALHSLQQGNYHFLTTAHFWSMIDVSMMERFVNSLPGWLTAVVVPLLETPPMWLPLLVISLVLFLIARLRRKPRRMFGRR